VRDPDPQRAAALANAVADAFVQHHLDRKLASSNDAFQFLQAQKVQQEQKLQQAQDALQSFRERVKVVSLDVNQADNPVLARLRRLQQQLTDVQLQRIDLQARAQVVHRVMDKGLDAGQIAAQAAQAGADAAAPAEQQSVFALPEVRDDAAISSLRAQLLDAQKEGARLVDTYGPEHPQYRAARKKIDMLQQQLAAAIPRVAGSMDAQLEMLTNQENDLRAQYDAQNAAALELSKQALTYDRLMSDVTRQSKLFDVLVERLREVNLTADYTKTNVEVADRAEPPALPVSPRKVRAGILSLLLGLLLGLGAAFLAEYMDETVNTPEDLEARTGIPVLGFVPAIRRRSSPGGNSHRGRISIVEPLSSVTEAYRGIRTNLFFSGPQQAHVLVVSSGAAGDGKTTTAANLAIVIGQSGKRALLIDADCRRPRVHEIFGLPNETGLSSVLAGQATLEAAAQQPLDDEGQPVEKLHVLSAGPSEPNPAELLGSAAMRKLLQDARELYDRVIIDTPPVLFVADASILAAMSDGVVLVVKSSKNTRALARRTRAQLEGVNARILGGVLNNVRLTRFGHHYSDYYHYGYSRYYRDYAKAYYSQRRA
jgi:succinoglycan biosynthesis transport protein ExoP